MYEVELVAINNSLTDTIKDAVAELILPEGLSLATMVGEQQTAIQTIGSLAEGESASVHWYVRGDEEGTYSIAATLKGTMQPFGDTFEYTYTAEDAIKVYAGSAMKLTFYLPLMKMLWRDHRKYPRNWAGVSWMHKYLGFLFVVSLSSRMGRRMFG